MNPTELNPQNGGKRTPKSAQPCRRSKPRDDGRPDPLLYANTTRYATDPKSPRLDRRAPPSISAQNWVLYELVLHIITQNYLGAKMFSGALPPYPQRRSAVLPACACSVATQQEAEAKVIMPVEGRVPAPVRRSAEPRVVVPAPAAKPAVRGAVRSLRINRRSSRISAVIV